MTNRPPFEDHEFYIYDLSLNLLGGNGHGNLLERLRESKSYLVDTNSGAKRLATDFPQLNFVIGATHCEETENLEGVLFSKIPSGGFPNLFVTEIAAKPRPHIGFHRVSSAYRAVLNTIPSLSQNSPEHRKDLERTAASFRAQLNAHLTRPLDAINHLLDTALPLCRNSFQLSGNVATLTMACYILTEKRETARLLKSSYINQRGDPMLIAEALLYGFSIVSEDGDVAWMGRRAGIKVTTHAQLGAGRPN